MKNYITNIIIILILLLISYQILTESSIVIESVLYSMNIWKNNLFPPMFTFFVLSEILISYGFVEFLGEIFKIPAYYLFKINKNSIFVVVLGMISGFPSSAKYIKELYLNNKITLKEANKLILFTHFSNPLFILGTLSLSILKNKNIGILVLISHYLGNFVIGIIFRNYNKSLINYDKQSFKETILEVNKNNKTLVQTITTAINNAINTLLLILGIITICTILTNIVNKHISNSFLSIIINMFFEMTKGLNYIGTLNVSLLIKGLLSTIIISFGGISVHMQISSIISDTKIKYMPFLGARILHSFISAILFVILFNLIH